MDLNIPTYFLNIRRDMETLSENMIFVHLGIWNLYLLESLYTELCEILKFVLRTF